MIKVSIVVPVYNGARYIAKCLDSIMGQTLQEIEILCVDAFSTDGTREIIQEYQTRDSRICLLDDIKGSSGYADNLGFKTAKGEYVAIVESDDYIRQDMMERLYTIAKEHDLDYVKADFSMFIEVGNEMITVDRAKAFKNDELYGRVIRPSDYPEILYMDYYMWKGIYKRQFILTHGIFLNETKGAAYQDNGFLHQSILWADRVMYIKDSLYQYRRDNENASDYNANGLVMMLEEYKYVEKFVNGHKEIVHPFRKWYYYKMFITFRSQLDKSVRVKGFEGEIPCVMEECCQLLQKGVASDEIDPRIFGEQLKEFHWMLSDPQGYYENYQRIVMEQDREYAGLIQEIREYEEVVLVSCGDRGVHLYFALRTGGLHNVAVFCDNAKEKQGKKIGGLEVMAVEAACKKYPNALFCIANEIYSDILRRQLLQAGIAKQSIRIVNWSANVKAPLLQRTES